MQEEEGKEEEVEKGGGRERWDERGRFDRKERELKRKEGRGGGRRKKRRNKKRRRNRRVGMAGEKHQLLV